MKWSIIIIVGVALSGGYANPAVADLAVGFPSSVLTNAAQVRALPSDQARLALSARVRGVVTYMDSPRQMMFIQDATSGVFVSITEQQTELPVGQMVEVTGVSHAGQYSPIITATQTEAVGSGALPAPPFSTIHGLASGKLDGCWAQTEGVVGSAFVEQGRLVLHVAKNKDWLRVVVRTAPGDWKRFLNARVRLTGVSAAAVDLERRLTGAQLFVPTESQVEVEQAAEKDPFDVPVRPIEVVCREEATAIPVHVMGTVIRSGQRQTFLIRDETATMPFEISNTADLTPGMWVDLIGSLVGTRDMLTATKFRRLGVGVADSPSSPQHDSPQELTTAQDIRALTVKEAAARYPVRLRGVVTFNDPRGIFVQDGTAGIYVGHHGYKLDLQVGDWVELSGVTAPGEFAPIVERPRFEILGRGPLPVGTLYSLEELQSGAQDSQWLQIEGVVHSVAAEGKWAVMDVVNGRAHCKVYIPDAETNSAASDLIDANVRFTGVCGTIFNARRQLIGVDLSVPSLEFVSRSHKPSGDPFSRPVRPIAALLQFRATEDSSHRQHVQGVVTFEKPKEFLYLQDKTGGLLVKTDRTEDFAEGDWLDIVGFVVPGNRTPSLVQTNIRKLATNKATAPRAITAEQALNIDSANENFDARLVRVQGRLLDLAVRSTEKTFLLRQSNAVFSASLTDSGNKKFYTSLRVGSLLEMTGVCAAEINANGAPTTFRINLRSPADIKILEHGPWWSARHTLAVVLCLGVLSLHIAVWIAMLRRRVRIQTETIRLRLESEQALEARYRELFENNPHPMWVYDQQTLAFLAVNEAAVRHYGYSVNEFLGMTVRDICSADGASHTSTEKPGPWKHAKRNGDEIDVEVTKQPLMFAGRPAKVVLITDITERIHRDQELQRAREFLNSVVENLPTMVFIKEADGLRFVLLNKAGEELIGYSNSELLGKNDYDFFPKAEADHFTAIDRQTLAGGHLIDFAEPFDWSGAKGWVIEQALSIAKDNGQ